MTFCAPLNRIAALAATLALTQAHFAFVRVALNGEWQAPTRFVRNRTEPFTELSTPYATDNVREYTYPTYQSDYPESVRCGRDNMAHAGGTETLKVKAGDTIEVAHVRSGPKSWSDVIFEGCPDNRGSCYAPPWIMDINHPGPFLVHLSPVPAGKSITTYDGSGEWIKIYTLGLEPTPTANLSAPVNWLAWNFGEQPPHYVFQIPKGTPAGEYLMRVDIIWSAVRPDSDYDQPIDAQLYPSCVQILVESESKTDLPKGVLIPEIFHWSQPGMVTSLEMRRFEIVDRNFTYPGGQLWDGHKLIEDKPIFNVET